MKQYHLFAGSNQRVFGGMSSYLGAFETKKECLQHIGKKIKEGKIILWWHTAVVHENGELVLDYSPVTE